jgi:Cu-processing system permease protein
MTVVLAIAGNTWKQFVRDRVFYIALIVAFLMLGFSYFLATLTIVESRKILLDFGLSATSLAGAMMALYLGVAAVAKEIELRTIYTILSKPVSRSGYLAGKLLGCFSVLAVGHLLLGLTVRFILFAASEPVPEGFYSCLLLILMESTLLLGIASFFSVFSNTILASGLTFAFFLIGRSNQAFLTMSEKAATDEVKAIASAFYYFFPNLERYNIRDVVAYGQPYPEQMIWIGLLYLVGYLLFAFAGACLIFERRDLP